MHHHAFYLGCAIHILQDTHIAAAITFKVSTRPIILSPYSATNLFRSWTIVKRAHSHPTVLYSRYDYETFFPLPLLAFQVSSGCLEWAESWNDLSRTTVPKAFWFIKFYYDWIKYKISLALNRFLKFHLERARFGSSL